jgi:hypothetical protein
VNELLCWFFKEQEAGAGGAPASWCQRRFGMLRRYRSQGGRAQPGRLHDPLTVERDVAGRCRTRAAQAGMPVLLLVVLYRTAQAKTAQARTAQAGMPVLLMERQATWPAVPDLNLNVRF